MLNNKSIIEKISGNRNHWILAAILIIGSILRFYNLSDLPYSHDELSALLRTDFNSFGELIEFGVKTDYHPAGIQVFLYYWVQLVGDSEWIVKMPFILASIASIYLVFQVGKKWKNETLGLICAAFLATTQYSVLYGTSARPYASGLFFILVLVNVYLSIRSHKAPKPPYKKWIVFVLAGAAAAYNHHYSLFIAGTLGIVGLFFLPRKFLLQYVISGIAILLLYLPHTSILLHQLSKGGVGGADGWLGVPTPDFFGDYFGFLVHFSIWPVVVSVGILVYGIFHSSVTKKSIGMQLLSFALFLFPILFGYYYSRLENPILQFSILIFSHFFLYLSLFGHIKLLSTMQNSIVVGSILVVNSLTLIVNRQHYTINFQSIYEHVTQDLNEARKLNQSIPAMIECSPAILDFYDKRNIHPAHYERYREFESMSQRLAFIDSVHKESDYFYVGGTSYLDPTFIAMVQTKYPYIVWQYNYFSGSTILLSKTKQTNNLLISRYSNENWSDGAKKLPLTSDGYYLLDSSEFSPSFVGNFRELMESPSDLIDIKVTFKSLETNADVRIVALLEHKDSILQYGATSSNEQEVNGECNVLVHSFLLNNKKDYSKFEEAEIKIYVWIPSQKRIQFKDITISKRRGNSIVYSLLEEF